MCAPAVTAICREPLRSHPRKRYRDTVLPYLQLLKSETKVLLPSFLSRKEGQPTTLMW